MGHKPVLFTGSSKEIARGFTEDFDIRGGRLVEIRIVDLKTLEVIFDDCQCEVKD